MEAEIGNVKLLITFIILCVNGHLSMLVVMQNIQNCLKVTLFIFKKKLCIGQQNNSLNLHGNHHVYVIANHSLYNFFKIVAN